MQAQCNFSAEQCVLIYCFSCKLLIIFSFSMHFTSFHFTSPIFQYFHLLWSNISRTILSNIFYLLISNFNQFATLNTRHIKFLMRFKLLQYFYLLYERISSLLTIDEFLNSALYNISGFQAICPLSFFLFRTQLLLHSHLC